MFFILAIALLGAIASPAKALPASFWGLSSDARYWEDKAHWTAIGHSGASVFRMQFNWWQVEQGGKYSWENASGWKATYDKYVENAAYQGITVLPYLYGRRINDGNHSRFYHEGDPEWSAWMEFVRTAVQRYGHNGSFWLENPQVPYTPVTTWEVWNEPNLRSNNPLLSGEEKVQPQNYARFLTATTSRIRSAQSAIAAANPTVLHGGLYQRHAGESVADFMYKANGVLGYQAGFDGLSLHPYSLLGSEAEKFNNFVQNIGWAREAVNLYGGGGTKPIYVTELGWPRAGKLALGNGQFASVGVSESEQASLLNKSFDWLEGAAGSYNVAFVAWYYYRDIGGAEADESWDHYCGLRDEAGGFRTSWYAYQEQTETSRWPLAVGSESLGGVLTSAPDIASWNPGRLDVFAKGAGVELAHKFFEQTGWGGWENWGGSLPSESGPGAVSWGAGRLDVFSRTSTNSVAHWYWDGISLKTGNIGGSITSDPDVASWNPGRLDVFARGASGELVHKHFEQTSWGSNWENWGGSLAPGAGPGAVSWGPGRIDIVGRAPDGSVTHWYYDGISLHVGANLGGQIIGDPDIASWGPGRLDVFARGTDDRLYQKTFADGRWYAWERIDVGGTLASGPGAVSWGVNRIDVVAKSPSGAIAHWWLAP